MRFLLTCILLIPSIGFGQLMSSGSNSIDDLHRYARELRSQQRVLFVSFAPSGEDLERIVEVRSSIYARATIAYLTNGDGMPDGLGMPYPNQSAARWRERAYALAERAGAEHIFLNLPYIDAASTENRVRADWSADTVRRKWRTLIQDEKPDVVLVTGLEHLPADHPLVTALLSDISSATRRAMRSRDWVPLQIALSTDHRTVKRSSGSEISRQKRASERELREVYADRIPPETSRKIYRAYDWHTGTLGSTLPGGKLFLPRRVPDVLSSIDSAVKSLSGRLIRLRSVPSDKRREEYLIPLVDIMQKVDIQIATTRRDDDERRRFLLDWKLSLERIRGVLLGVRVWWHLSESILTERQITYLTIDSISGLTPGGRTEIFFPMVQQGWVINETQVNHLTYDPGKEFRLFSTATIPLDLPRSLDGLLRPVFHEPWYFFIVHQAGTAEYTFSYRIDLGITGAPRFSAEVLTPIVRAVDGEEVAYRLTNHSRDGVIDNVYAAGSLVTSDRRPFRLPAKDMSHQDTIRLEWNDAPAGAYLVDLTISGEPVANFLARRFPVVIDETKSLTVVGNQASSALFPALKRLGYRVRIVAPDAFDPALEIGQDAILVDEWIFPRHREDSRLWSELRSVAEQGTRIIMFSQTHDVLEGSGLFPSVRFAATFVADTSYSIALTGTDDLLREPNDMRGATWEGWIYRVGSNAITVSDGSVAVHARFETNDAPVIFSSRVGRGIVTYVDLNLSPQWANILPATYTLLANIVEDEGDIGEEK